MNRSHKIRLYPTKQQEKILEKSCSVARFAYNWGLERWNILYQCGMKTSSFGVKSDFIQMKKSLFSWANEVGKSVYEEAFNQVGMAFKNFFKGVKKGKKVGFPKFKKKGKCRDSFYVANDRIRFFGNRISIPKVGRVKMAEQPRFVGKLLKATVSKRAGRWFISLSYKMPEQEPRPIQSAVGLDLGVSKSVVCSDGKFYQTPSKIELYEKKLRRLHKSLSRKKKGSQRWKKAREKLSLFYYRLQCLRDNFLHKLTSKLTSENQVVCVEDLGVSNMVRNRHLARSIINQCFGRILEFLQYKAQVLLKVPRFFPSTQLCPACGQKNKMPLSRRTYSCSCGYEQDRDYNGSLNIILKAIEDFKLVDKEALALLQDKVKLYLEEARIRKIVLTEELLCSSTF